MLWLAMQAVYTHHMLQGFVAGNKNALRSHCGCNSGCCNKFVDTVAGYSFWQQDSIAGNKNAKSGFTTVAGVQPLQNSSDVASNKNLLQQPVQPQLRDRVAATV